MSVDTRNKRASVLRVGLSMGRVFADPDGIIEQADRQQAAYMYAGILAGVLVTRYALFGAWTIVPVVQGEWTVNEDA